MHIEEKVIISYKAVLDKSINPQGIYIGKYSQVLARATILAHDACTNRIETTRIGKRCVIGINSIIMAGVEIGDECVIGAGAVVTKDVPSNCLVVGNPGRIIDDKINVNELGIMVRQNKIGNNV